MYGLDFFTNFTSKLGWKIFFKHNFHTFLILTNPKDKCQFNKMK
jgi:hypothetical protein